ncbi:MAG TPA: efflux RND transporter periplasmic adaptor subunit [Haliangium sp.]|nr:efflux RND transporter periplasmic adaptor subunit [Haliangium sp.]
MKRLVPFLVVIAVAGVFAGTLYFLYQKSQRQPVVFETQEPVVTDIVKKTVATGSLVPRQEIEIKPRVSGVISKLYVEPGQVIAKDALLADIQIIPDMLDLNRAESAVASARISFENARRELERNRGLFERQVISEAELGRHQLEFELRKQELDTASSNVALIKNGAIRRSNKVSNQVRSTVAGTVLEVPVEEGESVIESNTFNAGTTVATVADMTDMIFLGRVDESEVGKLREGMELSIQIGAVENERLRGKLEYIAPKGVATEGVIEFEIRAAIEPREDVLVRAGYSANADIVLDRRQQVLAINEGLLQFEDGQPFVEVEVAPQTFEKRSVQVGLSDGINIEVLDGLAQGTKIKKPPPEGEEPKKESGAGAGAMRPRRGRRG